MVVFWVLSRSFLVDDVGFFSQFGLYLLTFVSVVLVNLCFLISPPSFFRVYDHVSPIFHTRCEVGKEERERRDATTSTVELPQTLEPGKSCQPSLTPEVFFSLPISSSLSSLCFREQRT